MRTLKQVFNEWAAQAQDAYLDKQWLLSKWEILDGIEWPAAKVKILLQSIRDGLRLRRADSLIDIGCGGGWIKKGLSRYVQRSVGLDISAEMLKNAVRQAGRGRGTNFVCGDICRLPVKDESFSRVLCYFVFINFGDPAQITKGILEIMRILEKGGRALIGQIPDKNYSGQYDLAKKEYLAYCQKTYHVGKNIRDICVVPVHPLERKFFIGFLEKEKIAYEIRDSFNPFYRTGVPETVPWRFDLVLEKK